MRIQAYFFGAPGSDSDNNCRKIFEMFGGESIGSGTLLIGPSAGERDVEYEIPEHRAEECKTALLASGYRLFPIVNPV